MIAGARPTYASPALTHNQNTLPLHFTLHAAVPTSGFRNNNHSIHILHFLLGKNPRDSLSPGIRNNLTISIRPILGEASALIAFGVAACTLFAFLEVAVLPTDVAFPVRLLVRLFGFLRFLCFLVGEGLGFLGLGSFGEGSL